ncbi:hypothetical protein [Pseudomonas fulva]|uniref:hypothetical protein n=1 Tax=Pseudomonas fulva TaxID=47880 RepID=UPI003D01D871
MKLTKITECRECGSTDLTWQTHNENISDAPHGRLRTTDVRCLLVLGCDYCSETLTVCSADQVTAWLNECQEASAEQSAPVEHDHDALVAAVCVLRSQGLGNFSEAVETARAALERKPS